jgi:hypothetical protein
MHFSVTELMQLMYLFATINIAPRVILNVHTCVSIMCKKNVVGIADYHCVINVQNSNRPIDEYLFFAVSPPGVITAPPPPFDCPPLSGFTLLMDVDCGVNDGAFNVLGYVGLHWTLEEKAQDCKAYGVKVLASQRKWNT